MTDLSPAQLDLIEHATGRNYTPKRDRNWLLVDGKDRDLCREMCVAGLMIEGETVDMFDGETHFTVTSAGVTAYLRQRPEKRISRGRQRYLSWLREDSGLRFGDWLKESSQPKSCVANVHMACHWSTKHSMQAEGDT